MRRNWVLHAWLVRGYIISVTLENTFPRYVLERNENVYPVVDVCTNFHISNKEYTHFIIVKGETTQISIQGEWMHQIVYP